MLLAQRWMLRAMLLLMPYNDAYAAAIPADLRFISRYDTAFAAMLRRVSMPACRFCLR